jgi:hypothetical protein
MKNLIRAILEILRFIVVAILACIMIMIGGATIMILMYIFMVSDVIDAYRFKKNMNKHGVIK